MIYYDAKKCSKSYEKKNKHTHTIIVHEEPILYIYNQPLEWKVKWSLNSEKKNKTEEKREEKTRINCKIKMHRKKSNDLK